MSTNALKNKRNHVFIGGRSFNPNTYIIVLFLFLFRG